MIINADGETHACTHEETPYGNVLETSISDLFGKMNKWHDHSLHYEGCEGCAYKMVCNSGCRMAAKAYYGSMDEKDPLFRHHSNITSQFKIKVPKELIEAVSTGEQFMVPDRVRFRLEAGYHTMNVRWANAFAVPNELAEFLIEKQASKQPFTAQDIPTEDSVTDLIYLIYKDGVRPVVTALDGAMDEIGKFGASVNPWDLPKGLIEAI